MAFSNEEVMRATELALRQYHVVQKTIFSGGGKNILNFAESFSQKIDILARNVNIAESFTAEVIEI